MTTSDDNSYLNGKLSTDQYIDKLRQLQAASNAKVAELKAATPYQAQPIDISSVGTLAKDVGVKLAQGVIDVGQSAVGLGSLATGGLVGQGMRAIGYNPEQTNQLFGQYLSPEQQAADDAVQKADGFWNTLTTALDNPRSILGSVAESTPGIVAGMGIPAAMGSKIALEAALATNEGKLAAQVALRAGRPIAQANEAALGTLAGQKAAQEALHTAETKLLAASSATEGAQTSGQIADQAQGQGREYSDYALPAIAAGVGTGALAFGADKLMGSAVTDMAAGTHTLQGNKLTKLTKEGFKEGVLEELPQSAQEQVWTNIATGKPYDEGVGNAAATGLLAGAAMGVGFGGLHGEHASPEEKVASIQKQQDQAAKNAALKQAIVTNNPAPFLQEDSKLYDPTAAVSALFANSSLADSTPQSRMDNLQKASDILSELAQKQDSLNKVITTSSGADKVAAQAKLDELNQHNENATNLWTQMFDRLVPEPKKEDVQQAVDKANTDTDAANQVVTYAMANVSHLTPEQAQNIADSKDNGLDDDQRSFLRTFADAKVAENTLKTMGGVSAEIYTGENKQGGNIGISQYQDRIGTAIATNNPMVANYQLGLLSNFVDDHTAKGEAFEQAAKLGYGSQIQKQTDGTWKVVAASDTDNLMSKGKLQQNGGLMFMPGKKSAKLVKDIPTEAKALTAAHDALSQAVALKFGEQAEVAQQDQARQAQGAPVESITPTPASPASTVATPVSPSAIEENTAPSGKYITETIGKDEARPESKLSEPVAEAPHSSTISKGISTQSSSIPAAPTASETPTGPSLATARSTPEPSTAEVAGTHWFKQSHAAAQKIGTAMQQTTKYKDVPVATATPEQRTQIQQAVDKVQDRFANQLATTKIVVMDNKDTTKATTAHNDDGTHTIAVSKQTIADPELLHHVIAHELAHVEDAQAGWASEDMPSLKEGGNVHNQIKQNMNNPVLDKAFGYIFKDGSKYQGEAATHEIYAQLSALASTNPELFHQDGPLSNAHALTDTIEASNGSNTRQENQTAVAQGVSTDERGSSTETRGQSTTASESGPARQSTVKSDVLGFMDQYIPDLKAKLQDIYNNVKVNLVAQFVKQSKTSELYKSDRPLASVKDFLSSWLKGEVHEEDFLPEGMVEGDHEQIEKKQSALDHFKKTAQDWVAKFPDNFKLSNKDKTDPFYSRDMMQYLLQEKDGKVTADENVLTAMAYAGYQEVLSMIRSPVMTDENINTMFNQDKDAPFWAELRDLVAHTYGFEDPFIASLGAVATQSLGFKLRDDAPPDVLARLQSALGTHIMALLEKEGYIRREFQNKNKIDEMMGKDASANAEAYYTFIALNRDGLELSDKQRELRDANAGSNSVLDKLFGADIAPVFATEAPQKFVQEMAQRTDREIPELQRKVIQTTMDTPHHVIGEMYHLMQAMDRETFLKMAGWIDLEANKDKIHVTNRKSVEAQNRNLEAQYDLMNEMFSQASTDVLEARWFVAQAVWRNFRAGFTTQSLNQQTSKIHRAMFGRPNWVTKLNVDDPAQVNQFLIAVGNNMGIKVDAQPNVQTLDKVRAEMSSPEVKQALEIIKQGVLDGDKSVWTDANQDIVQKVAASREGMMTAQALMMYAKYEWAKEHSKTRSTEITLLTGADGKTNGPMLTFFALGAAESVDELASVAARGGFYPEGDNQPKHFSEWFKNGGRDLYQDLAAKVMDGVRGLVKSKAELEDMRKQAAALPKGSTEAKAAWKTYFKHFTQRQLDAVQVITKNLMDRTVVTSAARNLVKTPLTGFGFGSALKTASKAMENKFIESIYSAIEDMAKGKREFKQGDQSFGLTPESLTMALNALIKMEDYKATGLPVISLEQMMEKELPKEAEALLRKAFQRIVGKPTEHSMSAYFDTFQKRRTALNNTIQSIYSAYASAYTELRASMMQELMAKGEVASYTNQKGEQVPLHDLTASQEAILNDRMKTLLPVMNTAYSKQEGNINAGLYLAKASNQSSRSPIYSNEVNLAEGLKNAKGNMTKKFSTGSMTTVETSPGVAGTPYNIHAMDSANMHMAMYEAAKAQALNVHDEIGTGFHLIDDAANTINKATVQNLLNTSPAAEAVKALEKQMVTLAKLVSNKTLSQSVVQNMYNTWAEIANKSMPMLDLDPKEAGSFMMNRAVQNAYNADTVRLGLLAKLAVSDQYTWEGGQYHVEQGIRDQAAKELAKLSDQPSARLAKAIEYLNQVYEGKEGAEFDVPDWINTENNLDAEHDTEPTKAEPSPGVLKEQAKTPAEEDALRKDGFTAFGEIGQATVESNDALVNLLASNPVTTGNQLREQLEKIIGSSTGFSNFTRQVLRAALKIAGDVPIHFVTKDTPESQLIGDKVDKSRGWYSATQDGAKQAIYLLGPEFKYSGLTPETVVHELLHAALSHVIAAPTDAAKAHIANLEAILKAVQEHIKGKPLEAEFGHINDVHELVSWGMSNERFQNEVLAKITGFKEPGKYKFTSAIKSLMQSLASLLGLGNQATALHALLRNTSGLFAEAAKVESRAAGTLAQMHTSVPTVNQMTTEEIYDALGQLGNHQVSPQFDNQLRGVMKSIVDKVYGPFQQFKETALQQAPQTPMDIWNQAQVQNIVPFASEALTSGFPFSQQEAFLMDQVESTLRTVLADKEGSTTAIYSELKSVYEDARNQIKETDLDIDPVKSKQLYDFVFKLQTNADGLSDYLSRFAALGLSNEKFNNVLKFATPFKSKSLAGLSFADKLHVLFERALNWIHGKITKTYEGQHADEKLNSLVQQLVNIEQRKKMKVASSPAVLLDSMEQGFRNAAEKGRQIVDDFGQSKFFQASQNGYVKLAGTMTSVLANQRVDQLMNAFQAYRDKFIHEKNGVLMGIINEARGAHDGNAYMYKLMRMTKEIEGQRQEILTNTGELVRNSFDNKGEDLTDDDKKALAYVGLRADLQSLLHLGMDGITELVSDKKALAKAITNHEFQLSGFTHSTSYISGAKILGMYLATNKVAGDNLRFNADNIANLLGEPQANRVPAQQATAAAKVIDSLASLYALSYMNPVHLAGFKAVLDKENTRPDGGNGVEMMLKLHQHLQQDSAERLFQGAGALRTKGYVPEVYNPYIEMQVVEKDSAEAKELEERGYKYQVDVSKADADVRTTKAQAIYTLQDGGLMRYVSGTLSFTDNGTRGKQLHNGNLDPFTGTGQINQAMMQQIDARQQVQLASQLHGNYDPKFNLGKNFLVPVYNANGEKVNYRYMMNAQTKDDLLQRDNRFDQLLGRMAASTFDKEKSAEQNRTVVQALLDHYNSDFIHNKNSYTLVGPEAKDPELREIWRLLPASTKEAVRDIWGHDYMMVRFDQLDMTFGYRKLSLTDPFTTPSHERDKFEEQFVKFFEAFLGKKAALRLRQFENIWQALVGFAKDTMVVKSGTTLFGNFTSNVSELIWFGVPLSTMWNHHRVALKGVMAYRSDSKEIQTLQQKLDTGYLGNQTQGEIERRIAQLKDSLARNPVRELVEAGMMPTIVEDAAKQDDPYSFEGRFEKVVDNFMDKLNPDVVKAAKFVTMAHDTPIYKAMQFMTQVSDFLAKYTLYQHLIAQEENQQDKDKVMQLVSDAFVNYDTPSHRKVQYANDMGLIYFSKYFLRIQKTIALLYRKNPGRALMLMTVGKYLDFIPMLTHSSILHRFGNPFSMGAIDAFTTLPETMTIKALEMPFR